MKHPITGEIAEITLPELLDRFDVDVRERVKDLALRSPDVAAIVVMENRQLDSSCLGQRSALAVGPGCTYKLEDVVQANFRLGDVPSRFQYPVAIYIL